MTYANQRPESSKTKKYKQIQDKTAPKQAGGTGSILHRLYREMQHTIIGGYTGKWATLMEAYLNDPRNAIPQNHHSRSSARGNLHKELQKEKMSWRVFCKGMRFLNIFKFELIVRTKQTNGRTLEFGVSVNLGESSMLDELDEPPKEGA
jgi:hypothetical protein